MKIWHIEVYNKKGVKDVVGSDLVKDIVELGVGGVNAIEFRQVYLLEGDYFASDISGIAESVLCDKITQEFSFSSLDKDGNTAKDAADKTRIVEIAFNPGVMDPWEDSVAKAVGDMGLAVPGSVKTIKKYIISGSVTDEQIDFICEELLYNKLIQHRIRTDEKGDIEFLHSIPEYNFKLIEVDMLEADDEQLLKISKDAHLFLNLDEMKAIQAYFVKLGRKPTDCEVETVAQTWSEHCYHKTFRATVDIDGETVDNLLKSTVMKATNELNKDWCLSVFKDNAGIIEFDGEQAVAIKVETHNHPSALEPYGGASTGIGGVIRDILGAGLGAKPVANTDVFCFAPFDTPAKDLPEGVLHPKRIMKGVVSGVRDYGNRMGIPTVNGAIVFDKRYMGNPLVYCGTVGIMPKDKVEKKVASGDLIIAVGGRTGRDGIHGATFSSGELTSTTKETLSGAVQIGNPIAEKKVLDVLLNARDAGLYKAITDCGAGGFSSAVGELGEDTGAVVDLAKAPLKYSGLSYTEIWISESQERMVLVVSPDKKDELISMFEKEDVEAVCIGEFTGDKKLKLYYKDNLVCDIDMEFLHKGMPKIYRKAAWVKKEVKPVNIAADKLDYKKALLNSLAHPNVCSKEWVVRQYDHEVQAGTIVKPFVGVNNIGPADAAVIRPVYGSSKAIALANGINSRYGVYDSYQMAMSNIDEAVRQLVCVGVNPDRIALLDNFCWGNPEDPEVLGSLVRAAKGCYDASIAFGAPFISGKDSLYNEYLSSGHKVSIPGTLLVTSVGIIEDISAVVTMDFKRAGSFIYIVGISKNELGGSVFLEIMGQESNIVPSLDIAKAPQAMKALSSAIGQKLVLSAHDISDGGLAVALSEMAFASDIGAEIDLGKIPADNGIDADYQLLFSESNSRFIVEVAPENADKFEKAMQQAVCAKIGATSSSDMVEFRGKNGFSVSIADLRNAWRSTINW